MVLLRLSVLASLSVLGGCNQLDRTSVAAKFDESVPVPDFSVKLTLTPRAAAKLDSINEGITVSVVFDGDGEPEPGVKVAPHRDVFLGFAHVPLGRNNVAHISGLTVPVEAVKRLQDPDYYVGIGGASSRLSHASNLLDCRYVSGRISQVSRIVVKLHCSLIEESSSDAEQ